MERKQESKRRKGKKEKRTMKRKEEGRGNKKTLEVQTGKEKMTIKNTVGEEKDDKHKKRDQCLW